MRIDLRRYFSDEDISQKLDYSFTLEDVEVDGVHPFVSPIKVSGLLKPFGGSAELTAVLSYDLSMPCSRCLEEILSHKELNVSHTLVRSLADEEDDDSYIQVENDAVDLDELFYSDLMLEMPSKFVCKEDCKGLCPECGKNLNYGSCDCRKSQTDPRLEILSKLLDN